MAFPVTINGRTYTLADFEGTNYVDGFPDALEDFVTQAGDIYNSTSTSSVAIGTGSKSFTTADSGKPYQPGTPLRIADAAAPATNFMDCIVTSYSGTSLVVDAIGFGGSGTKSSWTINIGGAKTVDGTLAVNQGGTGATTASAAASNLGLGTEDSPEFTGLTVTSSGDFSGATISDLGTVTTADINGGTIDGVTIGGASAGAGTFTTLNTTDDVLISSGASSQPLRISYSSSSTSAIHLENTSETVKSYIGTVSDNLYLTAGGRFNGSSWAADDATYCIGAIQLNSDTATNGSSIKFRTTGTANSSPTDRIEIDKNGNLNMTAGGGNIIMANGAGIDFSASEGGGASSSVLDDYEEGTFTPALSFGTNVSHITQAGEYTKIGNVVHFEATISATFSSDSSAIHISLPFSPLGSNRALAINYNMEDTTMFTLSNSATTPLGAEIASGALRITAANGTYLLYSEAQSGTLVIAGSYRIRG